MAATKKGSDTPPAPTGSDGKGQDTDGKSQAPPTQAAGMFSASLNFENTRKYGFDGTGTSKVIVKLVAVPPPSAFMDALAAKLRGGG